jgi:modulator of FtsH protease
METTAGWANFLAASAGAAAALVGLIFVALSINLTRILELPGVAGRAAQAILLLASALIAALVLLIPGQTSTQSGVLLILVFLPAWGLPTVSQIQALRKRQYYRRYQAVIRLVMHQAATVPLLVAGLSLLGYARGGLKWFAVTLLLSVVVALFDAWVLLVEILR